MARSHHGRSVVCLVMSLALCADLTARAPAAAQAVAGASQSWPVSLSEGSLRPLRCESSDTKLQDQDGSKLAPGVWRRNANGLTLYVATKGLRDNYTGFIHTATSYWNRSSCVSLITVEDCPVGVNCVRVSARRVGGGAIDGMFEGHRQGGYLVSGSLYIFNDVFDAETASAQLATVVHELGHALGLAHRRNRHDVMAAVTDPRVNPVPDVIDYRNLAVVYGTQN